MTKFSATEPDDWRLKAAAAPAKVALSEEFSPMKAGFAAVIAGFAANRSR